jgi:hypothetical protein
MIRRVLKSIMEEERETDKQFRNALEARGWRSYDMDGNPISLDDMPEGSEDGRGDFAIFKGPIERMYILYLRNEGYPKFASVNVEPKEPGQGILQPGGESKPEETGRGGVFSFSVTSREVLYAIKKAKARFGLKYIGKQR